MDAKGKAAAHRWGRQQAVRGGAEAFHTTTLTPQHSYHNTSCTAPSCTAWNTLSLSLFLSLSLSLSISLSLSLFLYFSLALSLEGYLPGLLKVEERREEDEEEE